MTKEDWKKAEEQCSLFSSCNLLCDGVYKVRLREERLKNRIIVGIYVNGQFKGEWLYNESEAPESKYLPTKTIYVHSRTYRKEWTKLRKKHKGIITQEEIDRKMPCRSFFTSSFNQMKKHLIKVCDSIKLVND
jgi:hypothetical protein